MGCDTCKPGFITEPECCQCEPGREEVAGVCSKFWLYSYIESQTNTMMKILCMHLALHTTFS